MFSSIALSLVALFRNDLLLNRKLASSGKVLGMQLPGSTCVSMHVQLCLFFLFVCLLAFWFSLKCGC